MNDMLAVFAVAIALGADAFSVALGLGLAGVSNLFKKRFVAIVAILHVIMPLLGLELGIVAGTFLGKWASIIGAVVLAFIGIQMIRKGLVKEESFSFQEARGKLFNNNDHKEASGWIGEIILGLSVSIDALTVGFGLGTTKVPIVYTVITTGLVAGAMTALGWLGARFFSEFTGKRAQAFGGVVLTLLAVKMLL